MWPLRTVHKRPDLPQAHHLSQHHTKGREDARWQGHSPPQMFGSALSEIHGLDIHADSCKMALKVDGPSSRMISSATHWRNQSLQSGVMIFRGCTDWQIFNCIFQAGSGVLITLVTVKATHSAGLRSVLDAVRDIPALIPMRRRPRTIISKEREALLAIDSMQLSPRNTLFISSDLFLEARVQLMVFLWWADEIYLWAGDSEPRSVPGPLGVPTQQRPSG